MLRSAAVLVLGSITVGCGQATLPGAVTQSSESVRNPDTIEAAFGEAMVIWEQVEGSSRPGCDDFSVWPDRERGI
jgi:hypothetical protein